MKSTHIIVVVVLILIGIVGGVIYFTAQNETALPLTQQNTNATSIVTQATSTESTSTPPTPLETSNWKQYQNATIGISFDYPRDFVLKSEQYSKTVGDWSAVFTSNRGEMNVSASKNIQNIAETKLQNRTIRVGDRNITMYIARRDVCDVAVAQTQLDSDYIIRFTFQSCGNTVNSLIKDQKDVLTALNSITFTSDNTRLFIDSSLGFAFRYPLTLPKPTIKTTSSISSMVFDDTLIINTGRHYNDVTNKNLNAEQLATSESVNASLETITLGGKTAYKVEHAPSGSAKERAVYATNKNISDILVIKQKGVDANSLDKVISTFTFIK